MPAPNTSFDSLLAITFQRVRGILVDNFTTHDVLLAAIKQAGGFRVEEGGHAIRETLMHASNSTVGSFSGAEVLDTTSQDNFTAAVYDWKFVAGTVNVNLTDVFRNSGRSQIANWTRGLVKNLDLSFRESVGDMLIADGTGNGGKDIAGLNLYVEDGTAWSTVGGIDSNANTFWRNQFLDFDASFTTFATAAGGSIEGMQALRQEFKNCVRKKDRPNLAITSGDIVTLIENHYEDHVRMRPRQNRAMNDLGFDNIDFNGVPVTYNDGIAVDDFYYLNTDYLHFVVGKDYNFAMSPFQEPTDQVVKVARMLLFGQMTCSNRSLQGRIIDLD